MFNIILDELPVKFADCDIKTDFRQALKFYRIIEAEELNEGEKTLCILECLFNSKPPNTSDLWGFINYYITGGEESPKESSDAKVFDFEQDSGRIHSAFMQVYRINLADEDLKMHWWEFLSLFQGLPSGTHLSNVIEIRSKEIPAKMNPKDKNKLMKAKEQYRLNTKQTLSLNDVFLGGK